MDNLNATLVKSFEGVLNSLVDGTSYIKMPPKGPRDLASLSEAEIKAKRLNENGESSTRDDNYNPQTHKNIVIDIEDSMLPKPINLPEKDQIDGLSICGIDGSNQRIGMNSFYLILARAAIVNFKYTNGTEPPYFYRKHKDASAVTWVDGNIFTENLIEFTNNKLKSEKKEDGVNIIDHLDKPYEIPFLVGYDHTKSDKSPSSHALGWAVKFQQALELLCLKEIQIDKKTICIKDGPLFSTSSSIHDTIEGLRPIISWTNQILVCVSKSINDSKLMLETLCSFPELLEIYFPGDEITRDTILSIGTDALLLQRILQPGHRTPLIKAVPIARKGVCDKAKDELCRDITPLHCYYRGKIRPQSFIRMEVPFFMWDENKELVEEALSIVAWQHELGGNMPFIQSVVEDLCQLNYEKELLEKQTLAALNLKQLDLAQQY